MVHVQIIGTSSKVQLIGGSAEIGSVAAGTADIGLVHLLVGTAKIGTIEVVAGTADIGRLIAGSANIGSIISTRQGDVLRYGNVTTAIQYLPVALTTSAAAQVIVTSVASKQIILVQAFLAGSPAMTVQFFSAATTLGGPIPIAIAGQIALPKNEAGWLVTTAGQSLAVTPSVSGNFSGFVGFIVV